MPSAGSYLNTWFSGGGAFWEDVESVRDQVLLKEAGHQRGLKVYSLIHISGLISLHPNSQCDIPSYLMLLLPCLSTVTD